MDSCLAAWMKPQVFTSTTLARPAEVRSQPDAVSRAASSSDSTSLRAQPRVTRLTVRGADREGVDVEGPERGDTPRAYLADRAVAPGLKISVTSSGSLWTLGSGDGSPRVLSGLDVGM